MVELKRCLTGVIAASHTTTARIFDEQTLDLAPAFRDSLLPALRAAVVAAALQMEGRAAVMTAHPLRLARGGRRVNAPGSRAFDPPCAKPIADRAHRSIQRVCDLLERESERYKIC